MIEGIGYPDNHKVIVYGIGQNFWNFHFVFIFIYAFIRFFNMYKTTSGMIKDRIKYVYYGSMIAFLLASTTNGILPWYLNRFEAIWLGPPLTLTWIVLISYAIFENALTEIPSALKQSVIYSLVGIVLFLVFFIVNVIIQLTLTGFSVIEQTILSFAIFVILTHFIFRPLRDIIHSSIDKMFFAENYFSIVKENRLLKKEIAQSEKYKTLATVFNRIIIEIKNPLTALKGYSQYLERNLHDEEFLLGFSKVLNEEVDRITTLIDRLAVHSQQAEISARLINFTELIDKTISLLDNNFVQQKVVVEKNYCDHSDVRLNLDPDLMTQAFLNILSNSIDSMTSGGTIIVSTDWDGKVFEVTIKDTGCGIPAKSLELVFNPFYTLKTGYTGLGLSTAKEIIERHEGTIFIESKLYEGTTITIRLPFLAF